MTPLECVPQVVENSLRDENSSLSDKLTVSLHGHVPFNLSVVSILLLVSLLAS